MSRLGPCQTFYKKKDAKKYYQNKIEINFPVHSHQNLLRSNLTFIFIIRFKNIFFENELIRQIESHIFYLANALFYLKHWIYVI